MASLPTVQRLLQQEVKELPESLASEVLDFVQFLKARQAEDKFLWSQVEATRAYRQESPDEVETLSAEEWLAETESLKDEA